MPAPSVIAAQGYTIRDFCKTPLDIAKSLAKLKKIGYDAVQVSAFGPIEPKELAKILTGEGLVCCATHADWNRLQNDTEKLVEEHLIIGCKHTAIGSLPGLWDAKITKDDILAKTFAATASLVAAKLNKLGLTFSYHNHATEFEKFHGRLLQDILIEESTPALGFEIDVYWVQHGGADPSVYIRKVTNRIPLLHLKDMTIRNGKIIMAEVGEGNLNWPAILAAAQDAGVVWYIIEQDTCERDPFDSLTISLRNLQAMGIH